MSRTSKSDEPNKTKVFSLNYSLLALASKSLAYRAERGRCFNLALEKEGKPEVDPMKAT
jgi:hypothetical protein